jgi:hypothetical protein
LIFDDAEKSCLQADNGSSILTIHSKEEQEFISEFIFKTNKIVDNIWLGLKSNNKQFKWTDGSEMSYTNWMTGSPSNKTDHNCVQMVPDSSSIGQWADVMCNKKSLAVCQKSPKVTLNFLHKKFLETNRELVETNRKLVETQIQFKAFLKNLSSNQWINYKLFTNTDGKMKALFIPFEEGGDFKRCAWDEAIKVCQKYNATFPEIQTIQKQRILESYFGQLGFESKIIISHFWINAHKDSSGKWKWITSGKEISYTNWATNNPSSESGKDYIFIKFYNEDLGKWNSCDNSCGPFVVCEVEVNF